MQNAWSATDYISNRLKTRHASSLESWRSFLCRALVSPFCLRIPRFVTECSPPPHQESNCFSFSCSFLEKNYDEQVGIPVECVPTTEVVSIPWGRVYTPRYALPIPYPQIAYLLDTLPPGKDIGLGRDLVPEIPHPTLVDRITDACKNIMLRQLRWRSVQ